jgi:hypothetical protein
MEDLFGEKMDGLNQIKMEGLGWELMLKKYLGNFDGIVYDFWDFVFINLVFLRYIYINIILH